METAGAMTQNTVLSSAPFRQTLGWEAGAPDLGLEITPRPCARAVLSNFAAAVDHNRLGQANHRWIRDSNLACDYSLQRPVALFEQSVFHLHCPQRLPIPYHDGGAYGPLLEVTQKPWNIAAAFLDATQCESLV